MSQSIIRSIVVAIALCSSFSFVHAKQARVTKIAFIQNDAFLSSEIGKGIDEWQEVYGIFVKNINTRTAQAEKLAQEIRDLQTQLQKPDLEDKLRKELNLKITQKSAEYESEVRDIQEYAQKEQQKMYSVINKKVMDGVEKIRLQQGWDAVMPAFFSVSDDCDITQDVAELLNKEYKAAKSKEKFTRSSSLKEEK